MRWSKVVPWWFALGIVARPQAAAHADALRSADQEPAASASVSNARELTVLGAAVRAVADDRTFRDAVVAIEIVDVDSGRVLAEHNAHRACNPASNEKIVTAAAALSLLRSNHRYLTSLHGQLKGSAVDGPLLLRGHGDPSLTTEDLMQLAGELYARGLRRIDGDIAVEQKFFDDQTTPPAFEQQPNEWAAFRAPVSAVAINENTITLTVRPTSEGQPASFAFDPPGFVDADGNVKTVGAGADNVGLLLTASGRRLSATLSGSIALQSKLVRYTRRVDDPQLLGGYVLKQVLEWRGIKVSGEVKLAAGGKAPMLAHHESAALAALLFPVGKFSNNFYAEMVFKSISGELAAPPARSAGSAVLVTDWLEKIGAKEPGTQVKNGSGLFDANRISPHTFVSILKQIWRDPATQSEFVAQLAIGGVDGTLAKRFRNHRQLHAIRAKTGTLDNVIALTGFVLGPPGKGPFAFCILFNDVAGKGAGARAAADKLVDVMFQERWRH
jgi:serine-type D-Ala-D-Ala carboxypeptidase/endopeptidase (penicillin-binding protein 4)